MLYYYANNAATVLQYGISDVATSMTVASASTLPVSSAGAPTYYTLQSGGLVEIVKCVYRIGSTTTMTIARAQEGTTAKIWEAGTSVSIRVTAGGLNSKQEMGDESTLTIASGLIDITSSYHLVDTESAASTDDLTNITGGFPGQVLYLQAANSARTVVLKDGLGNLRLTGDITLDNTEDTVTLIYRNSTSNWYQLAFCSNGT